MVRVGLAAVILLCGTAIGRSAAPSESSEQISPQHAAFFEEKVRPLLVAKCYECHSADSKILQGGLLLDSRAGWQKGGDSGHAIVPGKPEESLLIRAVRYLKDEYVHMPPKGKMSDDEIAVLVEWVRRGAPDPRSEKTPSSHGRSIDVEEGKKHWAFLPLIAPQPPKVADDPWCRTPIDRFIQAKLEAANTHANPPADRRTLIRRAYFDLIGLPPKPEEIETFVNDPDPAAYDKLLDRLLANPHFGERWGRHWLDVARFAESHGFEQDYDRPNAYHYRDFVIRALNDDLPYDKFVKWQIAGDEFEPENPQALMATGFLAAGVHATQITANQAEKERYDELDDITRTIGTTMLGLTIGCARCHDHKYDPVTQADYYRLVATFTKTVRSDHDVNLDPIGYKRALAEFEPRHHPLVNALRKYEDEVIHPRFEKWLAKQGTPEGKPEWIVVTPKSAVSSAKNAGGDVVKFSISPDGVVEARGTQYFSLKYTVTLETALPEVAAIRLEAMRDDMLPGGGPGMTGEGAFQLGKLTVQATPRKKAATPVDGMIVKRYDAAGRAETKNSQAWQVAADAAGRDHGAVFELRKPVGYEGGTRLTLTLEFSGNHQGIGRFRIALAGPGSTPKLSASEISEAGLALLRSFENASDGRKLTADERTKLFAWYRTQDAEWRRLQERVVASETTRPKPNVVKALISGEGLPAVRLHTQGPDFYDKTYVVRRGDPNQKVEEARPGFVQVLMRRGDDSKWRTAKPAGATSSFDRRNLANWLCDVDDGAGHLLARVIVNRIWYHHFGRGLVPTPSDFGFQAERPSHPELLDFLAAELIRGGWRMKPLHKLIMQSAAYRQSNATDPARQKVDPDNKLVWHRPLRRLEAEIVRDAIMSTAGVLDETMFGSGSPAADQPRRSIYFFVKRSKLTPLMTLFDGPDTLQDLAVRPETTVAPQALALMNNEVLRGYAQAFAKRLKPASPGDLEASVAHGYLAALGRDPTSDERRDAVSFLRTQSAAYRSEGQADAAELSAWTDFCQVLFSVNEFIYVK